MRNVKEREKKNNGVILEISEMLTWKKNKSNEKKKREQK